MTIALIIVGLLLLAAAVIVATNVKIVSQSEAYVVERLGSFKEVWETGIHIKIPIIDRIVKGVTLMEQHADLPPWPAITKDNVIVEIDTVVYLQVTDPMSYTYGVERPLKAIENLTATIMRSIIGGMVLDEILSARNIINTKMYDALHEATDPWGVQVNRVEIQKIVISPDMQATMELEMRAEREKRAKILRAEGEAEAILQEAQAKAEAIRLINKAEPGSEYLKMQAMDAFTKAADGQATKIFIPSDMQGIAGLAGLAQGISEPAATKKGDEE